MQGAAFAVQLFTSRSLSAAASALGSILYFRLAGAPISSSHAVALRQKMRPGPTSVVAGCAEAVAQPSPASTIAATMLLRPNMVIRSSLFGCGGDSGSADGETGLAWVHRPPAASIIAWQIVEALDHTGPPRLGNRHAHRPVGAQRVHQADGHG